MPLLAVGYLYGIGDLLLKVLGWRRGFGESVALSLVFWSTLGWLSFGHLRGLVIIFSSIGSIWALYVLIVERPRPTLATFLLIVAVLLRYALAAFFLYPYQADFIMHSYATYTILLHNGYGSTYYPFGVGGFGAFNLGFHFIAAGLSYLLSLKPMDSTVTTAYIFWGIYFWALYRWLKDPWMALLGAFSFPYPLGYLNWGGFPTLAALSLGLLAFRQEPLRALPYWLGAFSMHFIPVAIPFLVYIGIHFREWKRFLPYVSFFLLAPQYFLILNSSLKISQYEAKVIDSFVISFFPKSTAVFLFIATLAFLGYKLRPQCKVPFWGILLSFLVGLMSFLFAYFHLPINSVKSLYMSRMILLLLPPASYGLIYLWKRFGPITFALPVLFSSYVTYEHFESGLDPSDWKAVVSASNKVRNGWFLTSYRSEGAYLPALGVPVWFSHYIITQLDEFREYARASGFKYVVCDYDARSYAEYQKDVCDQGLKHPDVEGILSKGGNIVIYRLKNTVHPNLK